MSFLLDTNAYFLFFQNRKLPAYFHLVQHIKDKENAVSFYISEITSLEIHSVLGQARRSSPAQRQLCNREIFAENEIRQCPNAWIHRGRRRMNWKFFRDMQELIADTESGRGNVQATILELDTVAMQEARSLLSGYADRYNFGSHDALIAGSLMAAKQVMGIDLTLVTSDKGLKAMLQEKGLPVFDPRKGI